MTRSRFAHYVLPLLLAVLAVALPASAEWKEKVLYSFQGGVDAGSVPAGGVVFDKQGNLYVATTGGGPKICVPFSYDCGAVYELSPPATKGDPWTATLIKMFAGEGSKDASVPSGGLIIDDAGNLYGVSGYGGTGNCVLFGLAGCGTVYELSPPARKGGAWTETILYSFPTAEQGYLPQGNLVFDSAGNLYGATEFGGGHGTTCDPYYKYCGAVFELSPPKTKGGKWTEKTLHGFRSGTDGANPNGGLVLDSKGVIYGTSQSGGDQEGECSPNGCGTVFALQPPVVKGGAWTEKVLYRFHGEDGATPEAGVIFGRNGQLYGTAYAGANSGYGAVFSLADPKGGGPWKETLLFRFSDGNDGAHPDGPLIFDSSGNLHGTTNVGSGASLRGNVFRLKSPDRTGGAWAFSTEHGFTGIPDGENPAANLIFDKAGNLYSTTQNGGTGSGCSFIGCGTVFEIKP
ncbi:MAG: choice-of-anchor tandem repeat GloVer-containing protein [Terriglobales bacterium]|jgi:hypothetical protein